MVPADVEGKVDGWAAVDAAGNQRTDFCDIHGNAINI